MNEALSATPNSGRHGDTHWALPPGYQTRLMPSAHDSSGMPAGEPSSGISQLKLDWKAQQREKGMLTSAPNSPSPSPVQPAHPRADPPRKLRRRKNAYWSVGVQVSSMPGSRESTSSSMLEANRKPNSQPQRIR